MAQISLTFPDGNATAFAAGVTPREVAAGISNSLAKKAISATVNGPHCDLQWPITADAADRHPHDEGRGPGAGTDPPRRAPMSWPARCRRSGPT